jgi:hypothetical protein
MTRPQSWEKIARPATHLPSTRALRVIYFLLFEKGKASFDTVSIPFFLLRVIPRIKPTKASGPV